MNKFIFFLGSIIFFTSSLKSMKIPEEKRRQIRNYIIKTLASQKKSSCTTLLTKNGEQPIEVLNCLITWIVPKLENLFKNPDIKNNFIQASLSNNRLHKKLIPLAVACKFCDDRGILHPVIAAIVRSQLQINEQVDNLYLLKTVQEYYDYLPQ